MCLIVHKPAGVAIPHQLLRAAASLNADGWGLVHFRADGAPLVERFAEIDLEQMTARADALTGDEACLHLRRATRGGFDLENAQPLRITARWLLLHNGTLPTRIRVPGRSDSWHLARDVLRPLLLRDPELPHQAAFLTFMELAVRRGNRVVLADEEARRFVIVNRAQGTERDGLWLSGTRWIDRRHLPIEAPRQPQNRTYAARRLQFI